MLAGQGSRVQKVLICSDLTVVWSHNDCQLPTHESAAPATPPVRNVGDDEIWGDEQKAPAFKELHTLLL